MLGDDERTRTRFERQLEELAGRPVDDFDLTTTAPPTPTLVVHDRHDKEVPYADGVRVATAWPAARLHTTESLGHQRILRDRVSSRRSPGSSPPDRPPRPRGTSRTAPAPSVPR